MYVLGGRNTSFRDPENKINFFSQTSLFVDYYDFKTGKWSTLPAKLPLGSGGGAVVTLKNIIYYMGGERATDKEPNAPRKNVYYYETYKSYVDSILDKETRQGMKFQANYRLFQGLVWGGNAGYRRQSDGRRRSI